MTTSINPKSDEQKELKFPESLEEMGSRADDWMKRVQLEAASVMSRTSDEWEGARMKLESMRKDVQRKLDTAREASGSALSRAKEDLSRAYKDFEDAARGLVRGVRS